MASVLSTTSGIHWHVILWVVAIVGIYAICWTLLHVKKRKVEEAARRAEQERIAAEAAEQQRRKEAARRAEQERIAAEAAEQQRRKEAAKRAEQERIAAEQQRSKEDVDFTWQFEQNRDNFAAEATHRVEVLNNDKTYGVDCIHDPGPVVICTFPDMQDAYGKTIYVFRVDNNRRVVEELPALLHSRGGKVFINVRDYGFADTWKERNKRIMQLLKRLKFYDENGACVWESLQSGASFMSIRRIR